MAFIKEFTHKKFEYQKILDYCLMTTNIGTKNESILQSIRKQSGITDSQWDALHNIAVYCAEIPNNDPRKILHKAKFDDPLPLDEIKPEGETQNEVSSG